MADEQAEKTEPATPKRREEAREKGEVAHSRDVAAVIGMAIAFALLLSSVGVLLAHRLVQQARLFWGGAALVPTTVGDFHALLRHSVLDVARGELPLLLSLALGGGLVAFSQVGPLFARKAFELRADRFDPIQGMRRMVSPDRAVELFKSLVKLAVVLGVGAVVARGIAESVQPLIDADPAASLGLVRRLAIRVIVPILSALALLAAFDLVWVRYRQEKKLRMSRQDVREEIKDRDGNPHLRSRQRQVARELSKQRLVEDISRADVVVRNPTHFAVALAYRRASMTAPTVVAKGRNHMAERILEIARNHQIPIIEDRPLARLLYRTAPVGREVPVALFQAIAELLAYVYRLDRRRAAGWGVSP
ncbi:MAG: EscU/YscU/HrcU family type III secretion system export apparatus switch protein [Myxococcota bacterium]|nr:EscU/YscU/HrcU family type III secretion system export apparatus switch protein [Myxococcota bacterium]